MGIITVQKIKSTEVDERKGLIKTDWAGIRERVAKVEPKFTKIVDEIDPDKNFPIYLAYYPYGAIEGDIEHTYLPNRDGTQFSLSDPCVPNDVARDLGYGKESAPFGMLLDKSLELFIDLKEEGISIPWLIYSPGSIFPFARVLSKESSRTYAPNGLLTATSGARSVFMLPNIGSAINHDSLQRDFNIQLSPPKSLYEHWFLFKEIINSSAIDCDWRSCVIYFSEQWVEKIHNDSAWIPLKLYLHELSWKYYEYERNRIYYDITFGLIQKKRNLKPSPYLVDTARHLFSTALGATPGYMPACNEDAVPLEMLQKVFVESYGLKKYLPTIVCPAHFNFEKDTRPIYYSLKNPSTHIFSQKSRAMSSTLSEMRELKHIMRIFVDELSKEGAMCSDTVFGKIAKDIQFDYFHNEIDPHRVLNPSHKIATLDDRFDFVTPKHKREGATFASDAPFVRGCVGIKAKL